MVRYAVVGAGGFAATHIERIRTRGGELGCELAAVAVRPPDRLPGQVEAFADAGVEVFPDAEEMFDALAGRIDAVFVPTGIHTHAPLARAALARGHHVYLEKPPAGTIQEVDAMLAASADAGRMIAVGFQMIFSESINLIKRRVVEGRLGTVRRLRTWAFWPRHDAYYARNEWAGRMKVGDAWVLDGPSHNALGHQVANLLYLAGPRPRAFADPVAVCAELYHAREITGEDTSSLRIRTAEGAEAVFVASHCTEGAHTGPWIEMDCDGGRVRWAAGGKTRIEYADGAAESLDADGVECREAALANFTEAVRAGEPGRLMCDLAMGRRFTLAVNGVWESSAGSRAIDPRYTRRAGAGPEARTVIEGVNEAITRCAAEGKLFSEVGCPWARPAEPFDLTGYSSFPRRVEG